MTQHHLNPQDTNGADTNVCWSVVYFILSLKRLFIDHWTTWMLQIPAWLTSAASHNDSVAFMITSEENCSSMTWGKSEGGEKTPLLLSRFSENSRSCNPPNSPSDLSCPNQPRHTELPLPQTVGSSPPRRGRSPHLRDYRRLQTSVRWVGG